MTISHEYAEELGRQIDELEAENERLRSLIPTEPQGVVTVALKKLIAAVKTYQFTPDGCPEKSMAACDLDDAVDEAKAALAQPKQDSATANLAGATTAPVLIATHASEGLPSSDAAGAGAVQRSSAETGDDRRKERISMAREICMHRGESPDKIDRGGNADWEKYEPLAGAVIREAERLFKLRSAAELTPDLPQESPVSEFERDGIARCLFNKVMSGHAQWDDMTEPNKDDWRVKADEWMAAAPVDASERDRCIAICEGWMERFEGMEVQYTSAREYACDAINDIIDLIRDGKWPTIKE